MSSIAIPESHQVFEKKGQPTKVIADNFLTWVNGCALDSHFYDYLSMDNALARLLIEDRGVNNAYWKDPDSLSAYVQDKPELLQKIANATGDQQPRLAVKEQSATYDSYCTQIHDLPKGSQAARFHAWAESRMGRRQISPIFRTAIGHSGCPIFDHGFIADRFPCWGGDMFEEHSVESVLIGEPYAPLNEIEQWARRLRRNGFKVWIRDYKWHYEGVTATLIAAADAIAIPSRVLQSTQIAGHLPFCDFRGFWPSDRAVVTPIYISEPYGSGNQDTVGWSALTD